MKIKFRKMSPTEKKHVHKLLAIQLLLHHRISLKNSKKDYSCFLIDFQLFSRKNIPPSYQASKLSKIKRDI